MTVLQPVLREFQQSAVAPSGFIAQAPAEPPDHLVGQLVADRDPVELIIDQRSRRSSSAEFVLAVIHGRSTGGRTSTNRKIHFRSADIIPAKVCPLNPHLVGIRHARTSAIYA